MGWNLSNPVRRLTGVDATMRLLQGHTNLPVMNAFKPYTDKAQGILEGDMSLQAFYNSTVDSLRATSDTLVAGPVVLQAYASGLAGGGWKEGQTSAENALRNPNESLYSGFGLWGGGGGGSKPDPAELPPDLALMYANDPAQAAQFMRMRKAARSMGRAGTFKGAKTASSLGLGDGVLGDQLSLVGS